MIINLKTNRRTRRVTMQMTCEAANFILGSSREAIAEYADISTRTDGFMDAVYGKAVTEIDRVLLVMNKEMEVAQ